MLEDVLKAYRKKAEEINWKQYNQNELFFKYIENENTDQAESFFAGIVCRYWGYSGRIWNKCQKHVPFEECYDCVIDSIKYVLEKRVWENINNSLYNDPTGPDKAMHIAMKRQMGIMLSKYNAQRRMSNFNTLSLDAAHEEFKDSAEGLLFGGVNNFDSLKTFISEYFDNDNYLDALFLDAICYSNIKYKPEAIIKFIKNINDNDVSYYLKTYEHIDKIKLIKLLRELKETSSNYLMIKLNSLLYKLQKEGFKYE